MKVAFIDPPLIGWGQRRPWVRFAFSDIAWSYAKSWQPRAFGAFSLVSSYDQQPLIQGIEQVHVPANKLYLRNVATRYLLYRKYAWAVQRLKPDVIHAVDYFSLAVISQFTNAVPVITTPGNIFERRATSNTLDPLTNRALQWAIKTLVKRKAAVFATSEYMVYWWQKSGFSANRICLIPLPTEITAYPYTVEDARHSLGWSPKGRHLLCVAELRKEMQISTILNMLQRYQTRLEGATSNLYLHIIGSGEQGAELKDLISTKGLQKTAIMHGHIPYEKLPVYYTAADALIIGRRYNATPRVAQQALCYGTPVIANKNPSLEGFTGLSDRYVMQFDFHHENALKSLDSAIQRLAQLEGERPALKEKAQNHFGCSEVVKQLHDNYTYLLGHNNG